MWNAILIQAAIAAAVTGLLLWVSMPVAMRLGWVDRPGGRKDHPVATPTTGGLAIAAGVAIAALLLTSWSPAFAALLVAAALLAVVGMVDDAYDVRWYWRILAQVAAALILIYGGDVKVEYVGMIFSSEPLQLGMWAIPFTVLGTVGVINAINMCDGVDGLAGLLCGTTLAMLAVAALYAGNWPLLQVLVPVTFAIAAFLMFNMRSPWLPHAKVFLGNSGSAVLGLVIAWAAFRLTQNAAHPVSPVLAPWLLAPPLIDCLVLAARRMKAGRSPFHADRGHMHHLLLDRGLSPTQVAILLATVSCAMGLLAALVLRTNAGTETHLVVGFTMLTLGYFWLTTQRSKAARERRRAAAPARATPGVENGWAVASRTGSVLAAGTQAKAARIVYLDPKLAHGAIEVRQAVARERQQAASEVWTPLREEQGQEVERSTVRAGGRA
ncbi:MAG: undecaprenyl/decaprenyl-phosphate alpha-N-acetylglucosaminyl 1-phosphate transferase [Lysobacter sp.]|nr:undecaprenyl/decaprenyl-phosphate alpha-N-acetylglucosaminyl 1-phosphate transferase [Lysobacter sp.]